MPQSGLAIGVDVGGTKIAAGVVDEHGTVLDRVRVPTPQASAEALETGIVKAVEELLGRRPAGDAAPVVGVGVAVAGFVDEQCSQVRFAANLPLVQRPVRDLLQQGLTLPVVVENDAKAAAWGEFRFGGGRGGSTMVLLTLGTGLGSGFVFDERLFRGAFGTGPEFGHVRRVPGGHPCGCGGAGCWEQYVSGSALVRLARERAAAPEGWPALEALLGGAGPEAVTGPMVTHAATAGDPVAVGLIAQVGRYLGEAVIDLANLIDPSVVVVGGGLCEAGDLLLGPARDTYEAGLTAAAHRPRLRLVRAELGNDAGLVGAADRARVLA